MVRELAHQIADDEIKKFMSRRRRDMISERRALGMRVGGDAKAACAAAAVMQSQRTRARDKAVMEVVQDLRSKGVYSTTVASEVLNDMGVILCPRGGKWGRENLWNVLRRAKDPLMGPDPNGKYRTKLEAICHAQRDDELRARNIVLLTSIDALMARGVASANAIARMINADTASSWTKNHIERAIRSRAWVSKDHRVKAVDAVTVQIVREIEAANGGTMSTRALAAELNAVGRLTVEGRKWGGSVVAQLMGRTDFHAASPDRGRHGRKNGPRGPRSPAVRKDGNHLPKGVRKTRAGKFEARAYVNGKLTNLGTFSTPDEAFRAYSNLKFQDAKARHAATKRP